MSGVTGFFEVAGAASPLAFFGGLPAERLAHGYLFSGPSGVGKRTFARRLAQSLLCETPKPTLLGYCKHCTACTLFAAGTHPDFISSDGTIKIGEEGGSNAFHDETLTARDLIRAFSLQGYRSSYRVLLMGEVEFATHESANALLKFFEEPAAGVVVLLTTSGPGSLLPTIRSRMLEISFQPLPLADVERILLASGVGEERSHFAATASLGSVTRARAVLEDGDGNVRDAAFAWFETAVKGGMPDGSFLRLDDRSLSGAQKRDAVGELIGLARLGVRDWAAQALSRGGERVPLLASDQRERIARLPQRPLDSLVDLLGALGDVERVSRSNVSAGLVVDYLRMALAPR